MTSSIDFREIAKWLYLFLIIAVCVAMYLLLNPFIGIIYPFVPTLLVAVGMAIFGFWLFGH
jgi:hypothetical protein